LKETLISFEAGSMRAEGFPGHFVLLPKEVLRELLK
jgi:hypothetical protein